MEAQVAATAKALTIQYTLTNDGPEMIVAFNGIPAKDTSSVPKVDPNAVYVTVKDGVVQIAKRVFAAPDDAEAAGALRVRGTALVGGEATTEKISVPLPLQGRSPYAASDRDSVTLPQPVKQVQFCVGTALKSAVGSEQPPPADSDVRLVFKHGSDTAGRQLLACSAPVSLPS